MRKALFIFAMVALICGCKAGDKVASETSTEQEEAVSTVSFDADSAYHYVSRQVEFGPRVPNSEAHRKAGDWLGSELKRHGAEVTEQKMKLTAFDGTSLDARNIMGRYNPEAKERVLLVAHWDCRPWADEDPDEKNHKIPVDGANDGASGVGVLLEIARQLLTQNLHRGVDILFVDAEDYGNSDDDDSWALGARYFASNPPIEGYEPDEVIVLDMVGGENARFFREYFSEQSAPVLAAELWRIASESGYSDKFISAPGGGVTDDHLEFIKKGIPAVDIIEFNPTSEKGFNERWHTVRDTMDGINKSTLGAVGTTVLRYILR